MEQQPADRLEAAFIDFFKALAHAGRLRVAAAIAAGPRTAAEVAAAVELPIRDVMNHLGYLRESELAVVEGEGATARYRWNEARVRTLATEHLDSPRVRALAGASDERSRVLAAFFREGRLTRLPASQARRLIVLEHIAARFDADRTYTEREVNAILKEIAEDYTTLRRYLVDYLFLNRHNSVYWVGNGRRDAPLTPSGPSVP